MKVKEHHQVGPHPMWYWHNDCHELTTHYTYSGNLDIQVFSILYGVVNVEHEITQRVLVRDVHRKETDKTVIVKLQVANSILNRKQRNLLCPCVYPKNFFIRFPTHFRLGFFIVWTSSIINVYSHNFCPIMHAREPPISTACLLTNVVIAWLSW